MVKFILILIFLPTLLYGQVGNFKFKTKNSSSNVDLTEYENKSGASLLDSSYMKLQRHVNVIQKMNPDEVSEADSTLLADYETLRKELEAHDTSTKGDDKSTSADAFVAGYSDLKEEFIGKHKVLIENIDKDYDKRKAEKFTEIQASSDPAEIRELRKELANLESKQKEAKDACKELLIFSKEYDYLERTSDRQLDKFPVKNSVDAQLYYNSYVDDKKAQFLNQSLISYSPKGETISIFNEIYADYFGPLRFSFGALISSNAEDEEDEEEEETENIQDNAVQRILGGGGNGVIAIGYPLLNYNTKDERFYFKFALAPKFGVDVPQLGTTTSDYAWNWNAGFEGVTYYTGMLDILTFFGGYRYSKIGGDSIFFENLAKEDKKSFSLNQLTIGLAINSTFRLSWSKYTGGPFVKEQFSNSISFSIIPNQ